MNYYFAPLEGITGYIYRNTYEKHFGGIHKYFAPFISTNQHFGIQNREKRDVSPDNNKGIYLVPQILTNKADQFYDMANKMADLGYKEVNLNLGCPSKTVVTKKKGSGFLAYPEELNNFLDEIFWYCQDMEISIKTRIGMESVDEWAGLLEIYNQYPIKELIVHARVRSDFYKEKTRKEAYVYAMENSKNPLCYNGDIFTVRDYCGLKNIAADVENVMLGRGLIANPFLAEDLYKSEQEGYKETEFALTKDRCVKLQDFHDEIYEEYRKILSGDQPVLFKMKELWAYMFGMFPDDKKLNKALYKAKKCAEYEAVVKELFSK